MYFVDEVDFSFQGYLKIVSLASETLNYSRFFSAMSLLFTISFDDSKQWHDYKAQL